MIRSRISSGQGRLLNFLLVTLLFAITACGNGRPGWGKFPVPIYSDNAFVTYPQAQSDLQDAMAFWEEQLGGQKLFDYKGAYNGQPYSGDVQHPSEIVANTIFFQNPWPLASNIVGQTIVNSNTSNQIHSAMVMINGNAAFCWGDCVGQYNQTSARKTFTHELGHFLGLPHVQDQSDIMYPQITPGGSLNTVKVDMAALRELTLQ